MSLELLARVVLLVEHLEPVVGRRKRVAVHRPVPSAARRADLLQKLAVAVKDVDGGLRLVRKPDDVPGVVVAVRVRREVLRVVDYRNLDRCGIRTAPVVPVPDVYRMLACRYRGKHVA